VDAILLLGSNLGDRESRLRNGIEAIRKLVAVTAVSRIYESAPFGPVPQPRFLNVAVRGTTTLEPHALLRAAKAIERAEGRVDGVRWGPRTLDVDIILLGDRVIREPDLTVPHPGMRERRFCLVPVAEVAPDLRVPPDWDTVLELLDRCPDSSEVLPK
jgi:2-amino-4-hydroxy-6-hydroxymethyldihydropteridine diphosphokinase